MNCCLFGDCFLAKNRFAACFFHWINEHVGEAEEDEKKEARKSSEE